MKQYDGKFGEQKDIQRILDSGNTKDKGFFGERMAESFMFNKGYRLIERNYRYKNKEIDLILGSKEILLFVEVKSLHVKSLNQLKNDVNHETLEMCLDKLNRSKIRSLEFVAQQYLRVKHETFKDWRIDAVIVIYETNEKTSGGMSRIYHIPNINVR